MHPCCIKVFHSLKKTKNIGTPNFWTVVYICWNRSILSFWYFENGFCCFYLAIFSHQNQHGSLFSKSQIIIINLLFCVHAALWSSGHSARPLSRCESPGYSFVSGGPEVFGRAPAECGWVLKWSIVERNDSEDIFPMKCQFRMKFKLGLT